MEIGRILPFISNRNLPSFWNRGKKKKKSKGRERNGKWLLNTTKSNVNLKNYANINLFYNNEVMYSMSFTEASKKSCFWYSQAASYRNTWNCHTVPWYFKAFNQIWKHTNGSAIYF